MTVPADVTTTYSWLRDGVPIAGATAATYAPTEADVGRLVTAKVDVSKPRYRPITRSFAFGATTTPSDVAVAAVGRKRKAAVRVRVTAPGATPSGPVTIKVGKTLVSAKVVAGAVRVVVADLKPGERTVKVRYAGDGVALPGAERPWSP